MVPAKSAYRLVALRKTCIQLVRTSFQLGISAVMFRHCILDASHSMLAIHLNPGIAMRLLAP